VVRYHGSTLIFRAVRKERLKEKASAFLLYPVFTIRQAPFSTGVPSLGKPHRLFILKNEVSSWRSFKGDLDFGKMFDEL
jgi:hypothetical protein